MESDVEIITSLLIQIFLTVSWLIMFWMAIRFAMLWISLRKDLSQQRGRYYFPSFVFSSMGLSEAGKLERKKFIKVFFLLLLFIALNMVFVYFGATFGGFS